MIEAGAQEVAKDIDIVVDDISRAVEVAEAGVEEAINITSSAAQEIGLDTSIFINQLMDNSTNTSALDSLRGWATNVTPHIQNWATAEEEVVSQIADDEKSGFLSIIGLEGQNGHIIAYVVMILLCTCVIALLCFVIKKIRITLSLIRG